VKAIQWAAKLQAGASVSINFMPNAVYKPELCLRSTLQAADEFGIPIQSIVFEFTENEQVRDVGHLLDIVSYYKYMGFQTALDDFGAGYAGLNLLARVQPDLLKIDMGLIRNVHGDKVRQDITRAVVGLCNDLGITVIAEGVESVDELDFLRNLGIRLYQGFYFAKPQFEGLARINPGTLA
jgi:EAL domain-containing protein (putative c-di-GMP-specific phosphodiesterase class I)